MRTLLLDNYDSFTFNLFQMIATINGEEPIVVRNDQASWDVLAREPFDNVVISPGPGRPERPADFGVCADAILRAEVPILGVCLGHQGIAHLHGAPIVHAPEPMHGRLSAITHDGSELWAGIPQGLRVVRYHSLAVGALPDSLARTAWTSDGVTMALRHRSRPLWGVQFHPESIATEHGDRLLANFRDLTRASRKNRVAVPSALSVVPRARDAVAPDGYRVVHRRLDALPDPEAVYEALFDREGSFWLDSSRAEAGLARFSVMGDAGSRGARVSYDARAREVSETVAGTTRRLRESIFDYLDRELRRRHCQSDLPFDFNGGYVGYFGYELKAESGAVSRHPCEYPDAIFVFADRLIVLDHREACTYLVCVVAPGDGDAEATAWLDATERALGETTPRARPRSDRPITLRLRRTHARYLADIAACQRLIRDGETYEICLTNQIHTDATDPLATYLALRRTNPAPYSALLRFGDVTVLSSSPERFLRVDREGVVESKPIKGTRPRGETPQRDAALKRELAESEKERAENLMIVDLLRNDLGIVCEVGSVHVPTLMDVESYETVHQLVSTVRGRLRRGMSAVECVKHAFPGGSMTGAPKVRTMNLLDDLEDEARGVYSGAIGCLGLNGTADLAIVIRTLVQARGAASIGVGGAIVTMSDPEAEFEETMLKARAVVRAVATTARGEVGAAALDAAMAALRETGVATL